MNTCVNCLSKPATKMLRIEPKWDPSLGEGRKVCDECAISLKKVLGNRSDRQIIIRELT